MPLVVEDGTGLANADSYISIADADAYHASRGNELWATISDDRKEHLLRRASDYISGIYRTAFIGRRYASGQALEWPRYSNEVGYFTLHTLGVPREIREAQAELALVAHTDNLLPNATRGKKSVKVGPIQVQYDDHAPNSNRFVAASLKLAPWLKAGSLNSRQARLVRV